jgi:hypothetical protein
MNYSVSLKHFVKHARERFDIPPRPFSDRSIAASAQTARFFDRAFAQEHSCKDLDKGQEFDPVLVADLGSAVICI